MFTQEVLAIYPVCLEPVVDLILEIKELRE